MNKTNYLEHCYSKNSMGYKVWNFCLVSYSVFAALYAFSHSMLFL